MELVTHKKLKGERLMPWGKGTVVTGAKGFVFLAGNTATADDYDPFTKAGGAVGDAAAQWRQRTHEREFRRIRSQSSRRKLSASPRHRSHTRVAIRAPCRSARSRRHRRQAAT